MRLAVVLVVATACGRYGFDELGRTEPVDGGLDAATLRIGINVPTMANLWAAGHSAPQAPGGNGAGVLPTRVMLAPGPSRVVQFLDVVGAIDFGAGATSIDGVGGASTPYAYDGLVDETCSRTNAIQAVFLDDTEPADPAPPSLVVEPTDASYTGIGLRQFFFVGDGLTGTGTGQLQTFAIPDTATRLFVGVVDSPDDTGIPGAYEDNSGGITATVVIR